MRYYLGIDGGGTKTKVCVINQNENIVFEATSGPTSIDTVSLETTLNHLMTALQDFYLKYKDIEFMSVFAGIGGIVFDSDSKIVEDLLKKLPGVSNKTYIVAKNDMENALYSGLCFDEGIVLICGTGMVAYGKDKQGNQHKTGGWGFKEGDLGSGYDLGFKALRHVIKAYDGRLDQDEFSSEIANHIGLKKPSDYVAIMNERYLDRTWIAELAPIVTKHANQGNTYARKIIEQATSDLALSIKGVYKRLILEKKIIVIVGSLGNADGYFKELLHQKIHEIDSNINIIEPIIDPAHAASLIAIRQLK